MNRRNFLKSASAALLLGPVLGHEKLWAGGGKAESYMGNALRQVWEMTSIHHKTVVSPPLRRALGVSSIAGESLIARNELVGDIPLVKEPRSLMFFGHLTDLHVIDEESPARLVAAEPYLELIGVGSAFRPQEDLTLQVLNSMLNTFNGISSQAGLDFMLNTGDSIDNAQSNELEWIIDCVEGGEVDPDSGTNQDPAPGPHNDANDPLSTVGFAKNIPWYAAIGNHDVLLQGNIPPQLREFANSITKKYLEILVINDPVGDRSNAIVSPWINPPDPASLKPGQIAADPRRMVLSGKSFIKKYSMQQTTRPVLGFPKSLIGSEFGYYSLHPKPGLPLKLIVLDTAFRAGSALGAIGWEQYEDFLIPELEKAKVDKELVIVASHHPGEDITTLALARDELLKRYGKNDAMRKVITELSGQMRSKTRFVESSKLQDTLKSYPNVFAHIAGHRHQHKITPVGKRGQGYWEIQSASLIGYPQQGRLLEIVYEGNGVGAIQTCVVDHESKANSLAALSRYRAYKDHTSGRSELGERKDRNTILRFSIPDEIAKKL